MAFNPKLKIPLIALAVCVCLSIVFTEALIAGEHDHNCIGEGCPVCSQIEAAQCFLETLKLAAIVLFFAVCPAFAVRAVPQYTASDAIPFSPVALKVRFNS